MGVLCLIILTGIVLVVTGKKENVSRFENALDADLPVASEIVEAILQAFYAYMGSSLLVNIAGEVENPSETIPKSLIFGLPIIAVIYILTNVSYLAVLTPQEIIASGLTYFIGNGLNMIALLKLRYKDPDLPRPYKRRPEPDAHGTSGGRNRTRTAPAAAGTGRARHQRRPEPDAHGTSGGRNRTRTAAAAGTGRARRAT
ncbi:hypothetical protein ACRRTK_021070 [Alexandromys fortis]